MYPLKAVLVSCDDAEHPDLRHELDNLGVVVEATYDDVQAVTGELDRPHELMRMFLMHVRSAQDIRHLERLNDHFAGRPVLALVNNIQDAALVVQAMRAGAAQVVALPLVPDDFHQAMDRIARQFGHASSSCRVIAVTGVTEGSGATSLAINLASEIAHHHPVPTILVELSLRLGRVAAYLDLEPRYTTHDLLSDIDRMDIDVVRQALTPVADHFSVLAGPYKGIPSLKVVPQHVVRLVDYVRRLCQVVVLDMPYTFDETYFGTIAAADLVVLVGGQNIPSIKAMKTIRETLQKIDGIGAIYPVINRFHGNLPDFSLKHLQELLQVPRFYTIANDFESFSSASNNGKVLRAENSGSKVLADIDVLADALLGIKEPGSSRWHLPKFIRRLVSSERS